VGPERQHAPWARGRVSRAAFSLAAGGAIPAFGLRAFAAAGLRFETTLGSALHTASKVLHIVYTSAVQTN